MVETHTHTHRLLLLLLHLVGRVMDHDAVETNTMWLHRVILARPSGIDASSTQAASLIHLPALSLCRSLPATGVQLRLAVGRPGLAESVDTLALQGHVAVGVSTGARDTCEEAPRVAYIGFKGVHTAVAAANSDFNSPGPCMACEGCDAIQRTHV